MEDRVNNRINSGESTQSTSGQAVKSVVVKRENSAEETQDLIEVMESDDEAIVNEPIVNETNVKMEANTIGMENSAGISTNPVNNQQSIVDGSNNW